MGVARVVHGSVAVSDLASITNFGKLAEPTAGRKYQVIKEDFKVTRIVTGPIELLSKLLSVTKGADKTFKVAVDLTKLGKAIMEAVKATTHAAYGVLSSVGSTLGGFCKIISPMNLIFDLEYTIRNISNMHWTEKVSMTCVNVSNVLETGSFVWTNFFIGDLVKLTHNSIAKAAGSAARIGNGLSVIPFVGLAANIILVPASGFGIANDAIKLNKNNAEFSKKSAEISAKALKWEGMAKDSVDFKELYSSKIQSREESRKRVKTLEETPDLSEPEQVELKSQKEFLAKVDAKEIKWNTYLEALKKDESNTVLFHNRAVVKAEKYNESLAALKYNANTDKATSWLSIADNVMKLVLGVLGITVTAVGLATGIALPAVAIVLAAGWLLDHAVGLTKHLIPLFRPKVDLVDKVSIPMTKILDQVNTPGEAKDKDIAA